MPSGITHDRITLWSLPIIAGISYGLCRDGELTLILCGGFLFSSFMFGPDLDIHSIQYQRWGYLRIIWLPYRQCLRHRSWLSHGIIIGTCLRILYLLSVIAFISIFIVAIAQLFWGFAWNWHDFVKLQWQRLVTYYPQETMIILLGLELGALIHSLSDWITSRRKQHLKKKQAKSQSLSKKS